MAEKIGIARVPLTALLVAIINLSIFAATANPSFTGLNLQTQSQVLNRHQKVLHGSPRRARLNTSEQTGWSLAAENEFLERLESHNIGARALVLCRRS
jgi:hypothetical protein